MMCGTSRRNHAESKVAHMKYRPLGEMYLNKHEFQKRQKTEQIHKGQGLAAQTP
jgi:hypothetical protein